MVMIDVTNKYRLIKDSMLVIGVAEAKNSSFAETRHDI